LKKVPSVGQNGNGTKGRKGQGNSGIAKLRPRDRRTAGEYVWKWGLTWI